MRCPKIFCYNAWIYSWSRKYGDNFFSIFFGNGAWKGTFTPAFTIGRHKVTIQNMTFFFRVVLVSRLPKCCKLAERRKVSLHFYLVDIFIINSSECNNNYETFSYFSLIFTVWKSFPVVTTFFYLVHETLKLWKATVLDLLEKIFWNGCLGNNKHAMKCSDDKNKDESCKL